MQTGKPVLLGKPAEKMLKNCQLRVNCQTMTQYRPRPNPQFANRIFRGVYTIIATKPLSPDLKGAVANRGFHMVSSKQ